MNSQDALFQNLHQALIDGCRKGDQKSQFQIYKLYYRSMYNISLRIVNDPMEAEDIIQEAFLSAFEKINSYSGTVSFGAWLRKIVQNRSIEMLRKKKMTLVDIETCQAMEDYYSEHSYAVEEPDPVYKRIMEIVKLLPEKCRNIFTLHIFEGYDHEEIAEILSINASTSRSQFSRARSKILREFQKK